MTQNVASEIASGQPKVTALINEAITQHRTGNEQMSSSRFAAAGVTADEFERVGNTMTLSVASLTAWPLLGEVGGCAVRGVPRKP